MQNKSRPEKRLPRFLAILLVLFILGTVGTAAFLVCRVKSISVDGAIKYTNEHIISMAGIEMDESMFLLDEKKISSAIQKDPYIQSVKIERQFPETVKIVIIERTPVAIMQYLDSVFKMDAEGNILEKMGESDASCPVISGMNVTSFQIGEEIKSQDPMQVSAYKSIMGKLADNSITGNMSEVNIANLENIYMMTQGNIRIRIGSIEDLDKKITWIKNVLPILVQQGKSGGTLDVTNPESASYIP